MPFVCPRFEFVLAIAIAFLGFAFECVRIHVSGLICTYLGFSLQHVHLVLNAWYVEHRLACSLASSFEATYRLRNFAIESESG